MASSTPPDDSEWEYEYDGEETEDFYVTLDLTTFTGPIPYVKETAKKKRRPAKQPAADLEDPAEPEATLPPGETPDTASQARFQILDLHTPEPLILYDNQLYACRWTSTIGTDLLFTTPSDPSYLSIKPLRSTPHFDLLAASSTRLVATQANVLPRKRKGAEVDPPLEDSTQLEKPSPTSSTNLVAQRNQDCGIKIPLPPTAPLPRQSQASFIERLSRVKESRGELDPVPIQSVKLYTRPQDADQVREQWAKREAEEKRQNEAQRRRTSTFVANAVEETLGDARRLNKDGRPRRIRSFLGGKRGGVSSGSDLRSRLGLAQGKEAESSGGGVD
ncbi:hypothetical protein LTR60_007207 [Cryomyces antarcticus]|nr:hypothetical protein LTR60_007207 [Cryomyces antarcticus]KAK5170062.1 hypothetical protein LTR04_004778 [Oleoguttula sp. CCFEE 6159]